ncbi:hypothetical protein AMTRI_Chr06g193760 [Amborella trichopoda]
MRIYSSQTSKIRLFVSTFRGAHSTLTRTATQQKMRALVSISQDRGRQKRDFRHLWIARRNAATHENGVSDNRLINDMYKRQLLLKIPAQIARYNLSSLYRVPMKSSNKGIRRNPSTGIGME